MSPLIQLSSAARRLFTILYFPRSRECLSISLSLSSPVTRRPLRTTVSASQRTQRYPLREGATCLKGFISARRGPHLPDGASRIESPAETVPERSRSTQRVRPPRTASRGQGRLSVTCGREARWRDCRRWPPRPRTRREEEEAPRAPRAPGVQHTATEILSLTWT